MSLSFPSAGNYSATSPTSPTQPSTTTLTQLIHIHHGSMPPFPNLSKAQLEEFFRKLAETPSEYSDSESIGDSESTRSGCTDWESASSEATYAPCGHSSDFTVFDTTPSPAPATTPAEEFANLPRSGRWRKRKAEEIERKGTFAPFKCLQCGSTHPPVACIQVAPGTRCQSRTRRGCFCSFHPSYTPDASPAAGRTIPEEDDCDFCEVNQLDPI